MFPGMGSDLFKRVSFRTDYKYAIWEDYVIICKVSNEYLGFAVWSKILQEFSSDNELIFPITNNILYLIAISGLKQTVLRSKTDAMRSERT